MRNQAFLLWSFMFALGVVLAPRFPFPPLLLLLAIAALILCLTLAHHRRQSSLFLLTSFLFFLVVGLVRGQQGDINLLPKCVSDYADHILGLVVNRLHSLSLPQNVTSLLDAMLLGQRQSLPHEMRQLYVDAGASHVLALSGLHLSILLSVFNYCLMRVLTYPPLRYALGILVLLTIWVFVLITGLPVSLVRASIMMSLFLLAQMRLCGSNDWHTLGLAAMLILFVSPSSLWSVGFQLSFAAMAGLILFYMPICNIWQINVWPLRWLWCGVVASFSAQVLAIPLVAYYFHQVSPYSVFLSPFYILFATLILYSGLLALVFGSGVAYIVSFFVSIQHQLMHYAAQLPGAVWSNLHMSLAQVVLQYMGTFCFVPLLSALQPQEGDTLLQRLARVLLCWHYIVAGILCFLLAYVI